MPYPILSSALCFVDKPWECQTWEQLAPIVCCQEGWLTSALILASSPQKSYKHLLLYFYSPTVSRLSVTLYFNVITVRWAYTENLVCCFLYRIHACKLFSRGLFLLLFYSCNLCISWITSVKYERSIMVYLCVFNLVSIICISLWYI